MGDLLIDTSALIALEAGADEAAGLLPDERRDAAPGEAGGPTSGSKDSPAG